MNRRDNIDPVVLTEPGSPPASLTPNHRKKNTMKCPVDGENLVMTDRSGVEIDYCPTCRGVWLDRGELDKIIERSAPAPQAASPTSRGTSTRGADDRDWDDDDHRGERDKPRNKRRGSLLGELFDF